MSDGSKIEWTDASWNPLRVRSKFGPKAEPMTRPGASIGWHCEHVSEGCRNCYAEGINRRLGTGLDYKPGHRDDLEFFLDEKTLLAPLHWRRRRKIFVGSMTDLFGDWVTDGQLDQIFAVMALCPQHTFQVLTKRPERMRAYFVGKHRFLDVHPLEDRHNAINEAMNEIAPAHWCKRELIDYSEEGLPLPNVWLGVSCEDQETADARIPLLLDTPAAVRFVSAEPLLGAIDLTKIDGAAFDPESRGIKLDALRGGRKSETPWRLNWVIVGGESGRSARPMPPDWARKIRDDCAAAGVAFFFKQHGEWLLGEDDPDSEGTGYKFQDGDTFWNVSDGTDIVISAALDAKEPEKIWRDLWGDGHGHLAKRRGKKAAGRLLDGVEHSAFPT